MTREEAIKIIREIEYPVNGDNKKERDDAIEMAIQALSQEPTVTSTDEPMTMVYPTIVCNDAISREAMLDKIRAEIEYEADYQDAYVNADIAKGMYLALEIFDKYKEGDNK